MWICPRCGEHNDDTFKECWKCLSDEMTQQVTATPPLPEMPPAELRSVGSVLLRIAAGFGVGMLLGVVTMHRQGVSLAEAAVAGAIVGAVIGASVGVFFWVAFPYKP